LTKGIELVDRAIELKPFYEEGWQLKMNMHYQLALAYLKNDEHENAKKHLDLALSVISNAKAKMKEIWIRLHLVKRQWSIWKNGLYERKFRQPEFGQVDKVKFQSINEMDIDSDNIPDQWNIVQKERVELSISEGNILVNNINDDTLGSFQTRNIILKPVRTIGLN